MKKLMTAIVGMVLGISACAQGWVYSEEFGTDFWRSRDLGNDFVDCSGNSLNAMEALNCTRKNGLGSIYHKSVTQGTTGLTEKVAAGIAAQRPRKNQGKKPAGSVGTYNYQTSDAHRQWVNEKRARDAAARQRAEEKKRHDALMKKIADDNRAAAAEAQTNARLQGATDRAIAGYYYNANEGARRARAMAKNASQPKGPQFDRNKQQQMSAEYKAGLLRRQNKPRRVMNPANRRNTVRPVLAPVRRRTTTADPEQAAMLRKAYAVRAELMRRKREEQRRLAKEKAKAGKDSPRMVSSNGKMLVQLGPHATSTLGKDWSTISLTPPPIPERETGGKRKMTQEEYHRLIVIEMIDQRPMTPEERAYYNNLTL